jgi:bifunctional non-homologous end joining protein LigD
VTTMGSRSFNGCGASPQVSTSSCLPSTCSNSTARREPFETRKTLASLLRGCLPGLRINEHLPYPGDVVFRHACKMGLEGIVSKRLGSRYISGRSRDWLKFKNPEAPAVKREAEEDWG